MPLAPADRSKLARVLALLGSDQPGEVAAAARAADRLVRGRRLDWQDVLGGGVRGGSGAFRPTSGPTPNAFSDHFGDLAACDQRLDLLTSWERQFVASLAQRRKISSRQREVLLEIAARVRAAGPRQE